MNRLEFYAHQINSEKKLQKVEMKVCPQTNIGYIILNSPKDLNSLSQKMSNQLSYALISHNENPSVNVIVIKSALAKIFCAGADIKRFMTGNYQWFVQNQIFNIFQQTFRKIKKPVIAAVNGKALGGGFQLALLTDIIVASQNAYFALPEVTLGLIPGIGGTQRLSRIIGQKMAMRYILTAQGFDGKKASQLTVSQLVSSEKFDENLVNFVKKISQKAVTTMIVAKKAVRFSSQSSLNQGIQFQKSVFYPLVTSKAAVQGVSAFVQKRKANFKGM